ILKKKCVEWSLSAFKTLQQEKYVNLVKEGLDNLGFKECFTTETGVKAIKYCSERKINVVPSPAMLLSGEVEEENDPLSNSDILQEQEEQEDVDDDADPGHQENSRTM